MFYQEVCSMLVVGPVCRRIPSCPQKIPKKLSYSYMVAFPQWVMEQGYSTAAEKYFFMCPNADSMG